MGKDNIRELIAFPKDKSAKDPVLDAPSKVDKDQLDGLGIKLK
jgi:aspartyl-tRNA synthetase